MHGKLQRLRIGRQEASLDAEEQLHQERHRRKYVGETVGQTERINLVPAIKHRVGEARAAEEHADDRPLLPVAMAERDQLAVDGVELEVGPGELDQSLERLDRI